LNLLDNRKSAKEPSMTQARIIEKSKNAMQSGRAGTGQWIIEFEASDAQRPDPLMGWAGSADTRRQLNLKFDTLEAAKAYADKNGIGYTVVPAAAKVLKLQAYADNFR
jgi:ETC complex I subunit conserved region